VIALDEPTASLDPDVALKVRTGLNRLCAEDGAALLVTSHNMVEVERLCDRVALINRGEKILDGLVSDVKKQHGTNTLVVAFDGDGAFLASLPEVARVTDFGRYVEVKMRDGADAQAILRQAALRLRVSRFEIVEPSLHDIFVARVTEHGSGPSSPAGVSAP